MSSRSSWLYLVLFAVCLPFLGGADESCTIIIQPPPPGGEGEGEGEGGCVLDDGRVLEAGDTFEDGCDTCRCRADGALICETRPGCGETFCLLDNGERLRPGEAVRFDDCESCTCGDDGALRCVVTADCCDEGDPSCGGGCFYEGRFFEEGDSFEAGDGCNSCSCVNGQVLCTEMACPICDDGDGTSLNDPDCEVFCALEDGQLLRPGESIDDGCNECLCTSSGELACTDRFCGCEVNDPDCGICETPSGELVPPGGAWFDGCNECFCQGGELQCTDRACPCDDATDPNCEPPPPPGCLVEGDIMIPPGGHWDDGCNECICGDNGQLFCTERACEGGCAEPNGVHHDEGEVWPADDGCNVCTCLDGLTLCTLQACEAP